jgi:cell shape-determining protein MreC
MKVALVRLNAMRSKRGRKENSEDLLLGRAERAEDRAQTYVNLYSIAMAELAELKKENERLRHKLARLEAGRAKITPLHLIKNKASSE